MKNCYTENTRNEERTANETKKVTSRQGEEPEWWREDIHGTLYNSMLSSKGKEAAERWKEQVQKVYAPLPAKKLQELLSLVNTPPPEQEEELSKWAKRWSILSTHFDSSTVDLPIIQDGQILGYSREPLGPPTPTHELGRMGADPMAKNPSVFRRFLRSPSFKQGKSITTRSALR